MSIRVIKAEGSCGRSQRECCVEGGDSVGRRYSLAEESYRVEEEEREVFFFILN